MATDAGIVNSERRQESEQFSTFFVADLFFGVDVLNVQEVLCFQQMTPVAASTVPMAAPPMVTNSAGWIKTGSLPFSIRKPPMTQAKTTKIPTIANIFYSIHLAV
jgi:hypothetical protein